MTPVFIDFETQSAADLPKVGGRRYAAHSTTQVLCMSASWEQPNGQPTYCTWVPDSVGFDLPGFDSTGTQVVRGPFPQPILDALTRNGRVVAAHNASNFDAHIWDRFVGVQVNAWVDTQHLARANGLPGSLQKLGEWFFGEGKDDKGKEVMSRLMTLTWDEKHQAYRNKSTLPGTIMSVVRYCVRDVELLRHIYDKVKDLPTEQNVINLDRTINNRGIGFDAGLAADIAAVSTVLTTMAGDEIERITGETDLPLKRTELRSIPKMTKWLTAHGVKLQNLRRETIEEFLENPDEFLLGQDDADEDYAPAEQSFSVTKGVLDVLRLRNAFLRVAASKLERASAVCDLDGRLRDLIIYHGAHTGRFSSRIFQLHNMASGVGAADLKLLTGACTVDNIMAEAKRLSETPDDVLSTLVRCCIVPGKGKLFAIADYSAIEARILAWLSNQEWLLQAFLNKEDPYVLFAARIYKITAAAVTKDQRKVGKVGVLGCGYGMGEKRMAEYALTQGVDLTAAGLTPNDVIQAYRSAHPKIAGIVDGEWNGRPMRRGGLWKDYEAAFKAAIAGTTTLVGRCRFSREGSSVIITLPSGRRLTYRKARMEERASKWSNMPRPTIVYQQGSQEKTTYGGKITENICQAIGRDFEVDAMMKAEARDLPVVLHVHDEIVVEAIDGPAQSKMDCDDLVECMMNLPTWAEGFPMGVEARLAPRYSKAAWPGYYEKVVK